MRGIKGVISVVGDEDSDFEDAEIILIRRIRRGFVSIFGVVRVDIKGESLLEAVRRY